MLRPAQALLITDRAEPMQRLLAARGWLAREVTWLPYASATAVSVAAALDRLAVWSTQHPNTVTVIVFDGHAYELEPIAAGSQAYAQAWAFGRDPELFTNQALVHALSRFGHDGLVVIVNDCCYAAGFAVALTDAAREHRLPPWVMLSLVAVPQATGSTVFDWTARIAELALTNPRTSYAELIAATPNVDAVFSSAAALISAPAFSLEREGGQEVPCSVT